MINKQKGSSTALMLIIIVLLLVIIFGGIYLVTQKDSDSKMESETEEMIVEKEVMTDTSVNTTGTTGATTNTTTKVNTGSTNTTGTTNTNTTGTTNTTTAVSFDGNWTGAALPKELDGGCTGSTISVNINGTKITGTAKDPISGVTGVVTGSVSSAGKVSSVFTFGGGLTVNWSGTLSGNKGSGSWNASDGCKGGWSLNK